MRKKFTIFFLSFYLLVILPFIAFAQPQNQPLLFHTMTTNYEPIPIIFQNIPAAEGWVIEIVCVGADHLSQMPLLAFGSPNHGLPTGDDFLADQRAEFAEIEKHPLPFQDKHYFVVLSKPFYQQNPTLSEAIFDAVRDVQATPAYRRMLLKYR